MDAEAENRGTDSFQEIIVEDNGKSVCSDTRAVWNTSKLTYEGVRNHRVTHYKYETKYPHAGAGQRVQF